MLKTRLPDPLWAGLCALVFSCLSLFAATASAQPARGKSREITGVVVDVDAKPVANATISVSAGGAAGPTATSAADGSFRLTGVPTANVAIEVVAEGYTARQVPVLGAATALQLQLVLVKPVAPLPPVIETRMVGGVVSDAARAPIAGAVVRVRGTQIQGLTGADGSFTLPGVAVGEVTLEIEATGQPAQTVAVPADKAAVAVVVGAPAPAAPVTRSIRGKVTEPGGEPLAGAQIDVAGLPGATVFSEADGSFVLENLPPRALVLNLLAPGHEPRELPVPEAQADVTASLALSSGEQIVIEGRAPSILKENITGGGSVIEGKDLTRVSAPTLDAAMTGKLAGANLQSNTGAPGGGAQLRLRGISTINGQASPLYVVDGVVISNVATSSGVNLITQAAAGTNPSNQDNPVNRVSDLNPNDIESVEVLKGASAAALYGSKAANGVVIITTKRGRAGENHASVTQRIGFAQIAKKYGARQWKSVDEVKQQFCSPTATPEECNANQYVQAYNAAGGQTFDHEDEILRAPMLSETLANVSGGTENGNYLGSVSITDQPGIEIGTFYKRQTGRVTVGYKFGDRARFQMTANVTHSDSDRGLSNNDNAGVSQYFVLSTTPNFVDLRPKNGVYPTNIGTSANPMQTAELFQNREELTRLITGATGSVDAYASENGQHKVTLLGNFGVDTFSQKNNIVSPPGLTFEADDKLLGSVVDGTTTNTNLNAGASATWTFNPEGGKYHTALTGGVTYESVDLRNVSVASRNLTAGQPNVNTGTVINTFSNRTSTKDLGGYLQGQLAMLDDRLSVIGGLLTERSSLNGDTSKYFLYPKLGAAFSFLTPPKAGEERLLDGFETLRLRLAYGETGNRPNYGAKFTPLNVVNNIAGNAGVLTPGVAGAADIEPERQREFELGLDVASKDQRVVAELTAYQRNISNMFLQQTLASSTGFGAQLINAGSFRNRGLEASLAIKPVAAKRLEWTSRGTLTLNRSMVTDVPDNIPPFASGPSFGAGFGQYRIEEGKSLTQIVATVDKNGTLAVVGDGEPDFRIGWANVLNVGDFTLSALLDWQHGSKIINLTRNAYDANGNAPDPEAAAMRLATLKTGDPRPYIEDASFVKLREISVSYDLPKHFVSHLGPLRSLQLSASGRNLLTFTNYSGLDPEVSNFGAQSLARNFDVTPYPSSRTFWFSITAGI